MTRQRRLKPSEVDSVRIWDVELLRRLRRLNTLGWGATLEWDDMLGRVLLVGLDEIERTGVSGSVLQQLRTVPTTAVVDDMAKRIADVSGVVDKVAGVVANLNEARDSIRKATQGVSKAAPVMDVAIGKAAKQMKLAMKQSNLSVKKLLAESMDAVTEKIESLRGIDQAVATLTDEKTLKWFNTLAGIVNIIRKGHVETTLRRASQIMNQLQELGFLEERIGRLKVENDRLERLLTERATWGKERAARLKPKGKAAASEPAVAQPPEPPTEPDLKRWTPPPKRDSRLSGIDWGKATTVAETEPVAGPPPAAKPVDETAGWDLVL